MLRMINECTVQNCSTNCVPLTQLLVIESKLCECQLIEDGFYAVVRVGEWSEVFTRLS